jgi:hypothetical protein
MIDLRSDKKKANKERRMDPRLEFHCDARVLGIDGIQKVTDISLGGIFIEIKMLDQIEIGQIVSIIANLPTERDAIKFKAKVVHKSDRGIGCQFIALDDYKRTAICLSFEMFGDTLPVGCNDQ